MGKSRLYNLCVKVLLFLVGSTQSTEWNHPGWVPAFTRFYQPPAVFPTGMRTVMRGVPSAGASYWSPVFTNNNNAGIVIGNGISVPQIPARKNMRHFIPNVPRIPSVGQIPFPQLPPPKKGRPPPPTLLETVKKAVSMLDLSEESDYSFGPSLPRFMHGAMPVIDDAHHLPMGYLFVQPPYGPSIGGVMARSVAPAPYVGSDIILLIDASPIMGHLGPKGQVVWQPDVMSFFQKFVETIPMGPKNNNRVGIIVVGYNAIDDMIPLVPNKGFLLSRLPHLRAQFRTGCTDSGIGAATNVFYQFGRPEVVKRLVLLTDMSSTCPQQAVMRSKYAKRCGIDLMWVGIKSGTQGRPFPPPGVVMSSRSYWSVINPNALIPLANPIANRVTLAPLHGGWSRWSAWNPCTSVGNCAIGYQMRFRLCDNPRPMFGGLQCDGHPAERRMCHMMPCIDNSMGHFTHWGYWSPCTVNCGVGTRTRVRSCTTLHGKPNPSCRGKYIDMSECLINACPVEGGWALWSEWGQCSAKCGVGSHIRVRQCNSPFPQNGGKPCQGLSVDQNVCDTKVSCPVDGGLSPWTEFSGCNVKCGTGFRIRSRLCNSPVPQFGGKTCMEPLEMSEPCDTRIPCPVHGAWSGWSIPSECSAKCGVGVAIRTRICNKPAPLFGGAPCQGPPMEEDICETGIRCPLDGQWNNWSEFSQCSAACGEGSMFRERICNSPVPMFGGMPCSGPIVEKVPCKTGIPCPIDGGWSRWSKFTPCPVKCGTGIISRSRLCANPEPAFGGANCIGMAVEGNVCDTMVSCPVHGDWSPWTPWSPCSAKCGVGVVQRHRLCNNPAPMYGGISCDGYPLSEDVCDTAIPCQVAGGWSPWSKPLPCSVKCGVGLTKRVRVCDNPIPMYGGPDCAGFAEEISECATGIKCPIHGGWSPWAKWKKCSAACGMGVTTRVRNCNNPVPLFGGLQCNGPAIAEDVCDTGVPCPIHGGWTLWTDWQPCSVPCGVGVQRRGRGCAAPQPMYGGRFCDGPEFEDRTCDTGTMCPIHGQWSGWSDLTFCSETCGVGVMNRFRKCNSPAPQFGGKLCFGEPQENVPCDTGMPCPIHGGWSPWSKPSTCSVKCGEGVVTRTRVCDSPLPMYEGVMCEGPSIEKTPCDTGIFCPVHGGWTPWSEFTPCNIPCGMGIVSRRRGCTMPTVMYGGKPCSGFAVEEKMCDTGINCPIDGNWSPWLGWGNCSAGCGSGVSQRIRKCNNPPPMFGGGNCMGSPIEKQPCDSGIPCPVDGGWTYWTPFSDCSVTCAVGVQRRVRECSAPIPMYGGILCDGPSVHVQPCDTKTECPLNGGWSPWTFWRQCSVFCGVGVTMRERECTNPPPLYGGLPCKGGPLEKKECDTGVNCPIDGQWAIWGEFMPCSVKCGAGLQQRYRECNQPLPMYGGKACFGGEADVRVCETGLPCPVDGGFSEWAPWSPCSAECGDGGTFRTRMCNNPPPSNGGFPCEGLFREEGPCSSGIHCAVNGIWSPWSLWSPCSETCDIGIRERNRMCDNPPPMYGGFRCEGKPMELQPCETAVPCPIDGHWTPWMPWSDCSVSCDAGLQRRQRYCTNPAPLFGGNLCKGKDTQEQVCNSGAPCPIDGNWSPWSGWKGCSVGCGIGVNSRVRICDSPPPRFGGVPCMGEPIEDAMCDTSIPCPLHGDWSPWSSWSGCSASCAMGMQNRVRGCTSPAPMYGGDMCMGFAQETRKCDTAIACPVHGMWSMWTDWSLCSAVCGVGVQGRTRLCNSPTPDFGGLYCKGLDTMKKECNTKISCPIDGFWSEWGVYGPCKAKCGVGLHTRERMCANPAPAFGGQNCFGPTFEDLPCDSGIPCAIDGQWTIWAPWGPCSAKCGMGRQDRTRGCMNPAPKFGGMPCQGPDIEILECDSSIPCPIHGAWGLWYEWSACSAYCGVGVRERRRECNSPKPKFGGMQCSGNIVESEKCDSGMHCPIDGNWSPWSPFSKCSQPCDVGIQKRVRDCSNPAPQFGGQICPGPLFEMVECSTGIPCPVDGGWTPWMYWGKCNAKCGKGNQIRERMCENPLPQNGGNICPGHVLEERLCNTGTPCIVHGGWTDWSPWSACLASCGVGKQSRMRECSNPVPLYGGILCGGSKIDVRPCKTDRPCPIDGNWTPWSPWDKCNAICGKGMQTRIRECADPMPLFGGILCIGPAIDNQECSAGKPCAIHGGWTPYTPWSGCSVSCGTGVSERARACVNPPPQFGGAICDGPAIESNVCDTGAVCPIDGNWSLWSKWTVCSVSCEGGVQLRKRVCDSPIPQYGGYDCIGNFEEYSDCDAGIPCPLHGGWTKWSPWGSCNAKCGVGAQVRVRDCANPVPFYGGQMCKGFNEEMRDCDTKTPCPIHGNWSPWSGFSECSAPCGMGTQVRQRECSNPAPMFGGLSCEGPRKEMSGCDTDIPCPIDGGWSPWYDWSICSAKCGFGEKERRRECNNPLSMYGGRQCKGLIVEYAKCDSGLLCPVDGGWSVWSPFSPCSKPCGIGYQTKFRECSSPAPAFGGMPCEGDNEFMIECDTKIPCPVHGNWSPWNKWDICAAKCGVGTQMRKRFCENPPPQFGGFDCEGPVINERKCDTNIPCPIDGKWTFWSPWGACTASCGSGVRSRVRECSNPPAQFGGLPCPGYNEEVTKCDTNIPCAVDGMWARWASWAPCSVKCGMGLQTRERICDSPVPAFGGSDCYGPPIIDRVCDSLVPCPRHGGWSFWSPWSECSLTCGVGISKRIRLCSDPTPLFGGIHCDGPEEEMTDCDTGVNCPIDGNWSLWAKWDICSGKCGKGIQQRVRSCENPPPQFGGRKCAGFAEELVDCDTKVPCPVNGLWGEWSLWNNCDAKCGKGMQLRSRGCDSPPPQYGGAECVGLAKDKRHCRTGIPCAVDGEWSIWSKWEACRGKCGMGMRGRYRLCNSPTPMYGGRLCIGPADVKEPCDTSIPCPVHGDWSPWSKWDMCDVKCGTGFQKRIRLCDNPGPMYGGMLCNGPGNDVMKCDTGISCPIDGNWSPWSPFSKCSVACGVGGRMRERVCANPRPMFGGAPCEGHAMEETTCDTAVMCPIHGDWALWTDWTVCVGKCGMGFQKRFRECRNPIPMYGGDLCYGPSNEARGCDTGTPCPVHGNWAPWMDWTHCDVKCGMGFQRRRRLCNNPKPIYGGMLCFGSDVETTDCDSGTPCPVHGNWAPWSPFGDCSASCAIGTYKRVRMCTNPKPMFGGNACDGFPVEVTNCDTGIPCPVHGSWSTWSVIKPCSAKCGDGVQVRARQCNSPEPMYGGKMCTGFDSQELPCSTGIACPVDGGWGIWSDWEMCSGKCGMGLHKRYRRCNSPEPMYGGRHCKGFDFEMSKCDTGTPCPIHGGWSKWSIVNPCSAKCGDGVQVRARQCNSPEPMFGGKMCAGFDSQEIPCSTGIACPVDGGWGVWSDWEMCSGKCGMGQHKRYRRCNSPEPMYGGRLCKGFDFEMSKCDTGTPCPIDGGWSEWSIVNPCSAKCGDGVQVKARQCNSPEPMFGGKLCGGFDTQELPCSTGIPCPVDGGWEVWSKWEICSAKCGMGQHKRYRRCNSPEPMYGGRLCKGFDFEMSKCDSGTPCPIHGGWSKWSIVNPCSAKCGDGVQVRARQCNSPEPMYGGKLCAGFDTQEVPCSTGIPCPVDGGWEVWSKWEICSAKCGMGQHKRYRRCNSPEPMYGGRLCKGFDFEMSKCDSGTPCPIHGGWSKWSIVNPCSAKCGDGVQVRARQCNSPEPMFGGKLCAGFDSQEIPCSTGIPCPVDGGWEVWSKWEICSAKCGMGQHKRYRRCNSPEPMYGGRLCKGFDFEMSKCDTGTPCPIHGGWSEWSVVNPCSAKCGDGVQVRARQCNSPEPMYGGKLCAGFDSQEIPCSTGIPCPVDGGWGIWSKWEICSAKCGMGQHKRYRRCNSPEPMYGGRLCKGFDFEMSKCDSGTPCPIDGGWSKWSIVNQCSAKCGDGVQVRARQCNSPEPMYGGKVCAGFDTQELPCSTGIPCPVDGGWEVWSKWEICSAKCGMGQHKRYRRCNSPEPMYGGRLCKGFDFEMSKCDSGTPCPIHGGWSKWSIVNPCSAKCGDGVQVRARQCNSPEPMYGGKMCAGFDTQELPCSTGIPCPVDGGWEVWSKWEICSAKCGMGQHKRYRRCNSPEPMYGGRLCKGFDFEMSKCDSGTHCPIHGGWSKWSIVNQCSAKCGDGVQVSARQCNSPEPMYGGKLCAGFDTQELPCSTGIPCPVDGGWEVWSKWEICSAKCGMGQHKRYRRCNSPEPMYGGRLCKGFDFEMSKCDTGTPCPIHGGWSEWSIVNPCSAKCGDGVQVRARQCNSPEPMYGGKLCAGFDTQELPCSTGIPCPVDGGWEVWSKWDICSVKCGMGQHKRYRRCNSPEPMYGGRLCKGFDFEMSKCDTGNPCARDGNWAPWMPWTPCSASCGAGEQQRIRKCNNPAPKFGGQYCLDIGEESRMCNAGIACPIHGGWTFWAEWSPCSTACGQGQMERTRSCTNPLPANGGNDCIGNHKDVTVCKAKVQQCAVDGQWTKWKGWSKCSVSCGKGVSSRVRYCANPLPKFGGANCIGDNVIEKPCDTNIVCPVNGGWSAWMNWSQCDCAARTARRFRLCNNPRPNLYGRLCPGPRYQTRKCSDCLQPEVGMWSKWSQCSATCGPGVRRRSRPCLDPVSGSRVPGCIGEKVLEEMHCVTTTCPTRPLNCSTECKWDNGIGYAEFPGDCSKFVQCANLYANPSIVHCPFGLLWSQDIMQCVFPDQSECKMCPPTGQKILPYHLSCRSYWMCNNGLPTPMCCPKGQRFGHLVKTCIPDPEGFCNKDCPPKEVIVTENQVKKECMFRPSALGPEWYEQEIGYTWQPRPCGRGTVFSVEMCLCIMIDPDHGRKAYNDVCKPELLLKFDSLKEDLARNVGVSIENVTYNGDGTAYFDGTGAVVSSAFANTEWGKNVYVYIRFKPEGTGRRQGLVHNSGCGTKDIGPSVFIGLDREPQGQKGLIDLKFSATPQKPELEYDFVNITTTANTFIDAWYKFGDGVFEAEVDGLTAQLNIDSGVSRRHGAINIGGNLCKIGEESFGGFEGTLDEVRIYKCKPPKK